MRRTKGPNGKIEESENTKKAILNLLEDLEKERENLQNLNVKNEAILASIGEGLVVVDKDMRIMLINKAAQKAIGWSSQEVINKVWPEVIRVEDEDGKKVPDNESLLFLAIHEKKTTTTTTYYYTRKDKTKFPVVITVSPFKVKNKLIGAIVVFRDITRERKIEKMQSEFISVASHQLRTPMTGIQWVIERFLKKEKLSKKGTEYLEDIHTSAQRLSNLIDLLLNVSRIEEGRVSISPQSLELVKFIKNYLEECEPLRVKKNLSLSFQKHPKQLKVISDSSALRNIIQAIVSNAIEYTSEKGKIQVFLEKKGDKFLFRVCDSGIGIPKEEQADIFNKFTRGSNAQKIDRDGLGLGLYVAVQTVKLLKGKIWFESPTFVSASVKDTADKKNSAGKKENKGTTFYVELPLKL